MPKRNESGMEQVGRYLSLAFLLPVSVFVGYVIGYLLDKAFGTTYLKIVFLFVGIAAGIIELIRTLNKDIQPK